MEESLEPILCEVKTDKTVYVVTTQSGGFRFDKADMVYPEPHNKSNIRYITLDEQKARKYMVACKRHIQTLAANGKVQISKSEDDTIIYNSLNSEISTTTAICLRKYYLEFPISEF